MDTIIVNLLSILNHMFKVFFLNEQFFLKLSQCMTRHCTFLSIYLFLLSKQFSYMIPFSFQNKRTSKTTARIKMMILMTEGYTIILSQ